MNTSVAIPIAAAIFATAVVVVAYFLLKRQVARERAAIRSEADRVLAEATKASEARLRESAIEAKEKVLAAQLEFDKTVQARRQEIASLEKRLVQKEENLDRKLAQQEKREEEFARKEKTLADAQKGVEKAHGDVQKLIEDQQKRLEQISGLTAADAKRDLIRSIENEARVDASGLMRGSRRRPSSQLPRRPAHRSAWPSSGWPPTRSSRRRFGRRAPPTTQGPHHRREGAQHPGARAATGVDLIIDDTPEAIVISAFEPIRREVARLALDRLIVDGRIHPARIEEIVEKVRSELWEKIRQDGEATALEFAISDLHPELIKLLGRLKYRTSYGQNVLQHAKEVAWLASSMAGELGARTEIAKRAGSCTTSARRSTGRWRARTSSWAGRS